MTKFKKFVDFELVLIFLVSFILITASFFIEEAHAKIEGVSYGELNVNGKVYQFPLGNSKRESEFYYLKKGLLGDNLALEIFLGGEDEKWWYIGEDVALWLKVTKNGAEIHDPYAIQK